MSVHVLSSQVNYLHAELKVYSLVNIVYRIPIGIDDFMCFFPDGCSSTGRGMQSLLRTYENSPISDMWALILP